MYLRLPFQAARLRAVARSAAPASPASLSRILWCILWRILWRAALIASLASLASCGGGGTSARLRDSAVHDTTPYSMLADASLARQAAVANQATTHHMLVLGMRRLAYTATAGHLLVRSRRTGRVEASMFYVAYTLDGAPAAGRPVTFFWNGGPGCSAIYLQLGGWGPQTLDIDEAGLRPADLVHPPRFHLRANRDSLLGDTDMVFVDPVGTGWSEAVAPWRNRDFWSVDSDARAARDFVDDWLRARHRTASPVFLYGESYGGMRVPIVARLLEQQAPAHGGSPGLSGLILASPLLDAKTNCVSTWEIQSEPGFVEGPHRRLIHGSPASSCESFIPSYIMVHDALVHPRFGEAASLRAAAAAIALTRETWKPALAPYLSRIAEPALSRQQSPFLPAQFPYAQRAVFGVMARATGLSPADWSRDFNMNYVDFSSGLLDDGPADWDWNFRLIDCYNAVVRAPANATGYVGFDGAPQTPPSAANYAEPSFRRAQRRYMADFLDYHASQPYEPTHFPLPHWSMRHGSDTSRLPQVLGDLARTLRLRPGLPVLVTGGEQDLVTPFYGTLRDLRSRSLLGQVEFRLYPGGHMLYLSRAAHDAYLRSLDGFYRDALQGDWAPSLPGPLLAQLQP